MSPLLKNLIIALSITVLIGVIYTIFIKDSADEDVRAIDTTNSIAVQKTQKIIADTKKINALKLDASILSDARFVSLQNTKTDLVDVTTGRTNPFAPAR